MKLLFWKRKRPSPLSQLACEGSLNLLLPSTRAALERIAEEFARDMLADPEFRQRLREEATAAAQEIARSYKQTA